jgi:flagella basal body P-ring formation protein FlgA
MSTGRSFLFFLALSLTATAADAATLRGASEVSGERIVLGDLFDGLDHDQTTVITNAPAPGQTLVLDARTLAALARNYRIDWQPQSSFDTATIRRTSLQFGAEDIGTAVVATLPASPMDQLGTRTAKLDNTQVQLFAPVDSAARVTASAVSFDPNSQRFSATIKVEDGNHTYAQSLVSGRITTVAQVPVLSRPLRRGDVISASDISWQDLELGPGSAQIITAAEDVIGRTPRQNLRAALPLRAFDLVAPTAIARGSQVTLVFESGSLQISTQGRALSDAAIGESVRVVNLMSSRTVEGRAESSGVVRVGPAPPPITSSVAVAPSAITTN